jgi:putative ABC transport system permease protein
MLLIHLSYSEISSAMKNPLIIPRSLINIGWRYFRGHMWQSALMVIGILLGVAVVIGVDMANESASQAFDLSTTAITGRATHYLSAGSGGFDEQVYIQLRREGFEYPIAPVITGYVTSPQLDNLTFQILGVDPFAEAPFRNYLVSDRGVPTDEFTDFLTKPNSVLISVDQADRFGLGLGDQIQIEYAGNKQLTNVVGILQTEDSLSRRALNGMLLMDIATAQEITDKLGTLDRVDLILPEDDLTLITTLQSQIPDFVTVQQVEAKNGVVKEMTQAFRVNLSALSLLAMVVALFLIYNSMTFSVMQRRPMFGVLRSLGVTRREIFVLVVLEALMIGALGAVLGTILGILMGRGTVQLVTQTINDLFFVTTVRDIPIPIISLIKGNLLAIVATTITAAFPAWEAASIPPRNALTRSGLETKARKSVPFFAGLGLILIFLGCTVLFIPTDSLVISFLGTFAVVIGLAMLTPQVTIWLMAAASYLTQRIWGALGRMAPREVVNSISRTSIAISALMVAVAVTIGVSLMVNSFRSTVVTWLDQILHGDIYISVPGASISQPAYPINPEVLPILDTWDEVIRVDLLQTAVVDSPYGPIQISANNNPNDGMEQIYLSTEVPVGELWDAVQDGAILVSEPLANRLDLPIHDAEVKLYTGQGAHIFPVAGIYYDYASTQGNAIMSIDVYRQFWADNRISAVALVLEPGANPNVVADALQTRLAKEQSLLIRPNQALREDTLEIFDRTFAITGALQLMTTIVAFVGVLSAMMSLQFDKKRQLGILRAIGLTARQLWTLVVLETGLMGAVAGLFAMPTGYVLAVILIYIINRRSFGWTLQMQVDPEPFFQAFLVAVGASLLAGLYPAKRILQRNTAEVIRYE